VHSDQLLGRARRIAVTAVRSVAPRFLRRNLDLEDIAHEAVWRMLRYGQPDRALSAIVRNVLRARIAFEAHRSPTLSTDGTIPDRHTTEVIAEDFYAVSEAALPSTLREVFRLHYKAGLPVGDIAERTGRSRSAVYASLRRCRAILREKFDGRRGA